MTNEKEIDEIILRAFKEDAGPGDITTLATIGNDVQAEARFLAKADGVLSGIEVTRRVFSLYDEQLIFTPHMKDGEKVEYGNIIASIKGKASSILTAERTALNFMQRMSGIATLADKFAAEVKHTKARIIDTRKTVPGLRIIDKIAVVHGGCSNHRIGLYDMFLIKDNHIAAAGSITKAVESCREYMKKNGLKFKIEVEVTNLSQTEEALNSRADIIMLDNFDIELMTEAVGLI
ncbi:MAG: carboxylating nicotinate-nucleotide diphosphorylase, partial [Syntrophothermus sp.]